MRKVAAFSVLILLGYGASIAQRHGGREIPPQLFPSQLILDSQKEISLTDEQVKTITDLGARLEEERRAADQEIAPESKNLLELIASAQVDEQKALASIDKLLALEQRRKRGELLHLIRLKNLLNDGQQKRLAEIRKQKGH